MAIFIWDAFDDEDDPISFLFLVLNLVAIWFVLCIVAAVCRDRIPCLTACCQRLRRLARRGCVEPCFEQPEDLGIMDYLVGCCCAGLCCCCGARCCCCSRAKQRSRDALKRAEDRVTEHSCCV